MHTIGARIGHGHTEATQELEKPLDPSLVSQRKGRAGRVYSYIEGHTAIDQWTADERFYRAARPSIDNVRWIGEFVAPE